MVVNVTKGKRIADQVSEMLNVRAQTLHSMIVLWWGSAGTEPEEEFANSEAFRTAATTWVEDGGTMIVHGEGPYGLWPSWFGKTWDQESYVRTDHTCFACPQNDGSIPHWCKWYHQLTDAVKGNYNVKSILIKNVDPEEILFGTTEDAKSYSLVPHMSGQHIGGGLASIAFGRCKNGTISFFGDVNLEKPTIQTMAVLARGDPSQLNP